jgi:outer membrane receptor for ferrienterochelin and colicins
MGDMLEETLAHAVLARRHTHLAAFGLATILLSSPAYAQEDSTPREQPDGSPPGSTEGVSRAGGAGAASAPAATKTPELAAPAPTNPEDSNKAPKVAFPNGPALAVEAAVADSNLRDLLDLLDITVSVASKAEEKIAEAPGVISVVTQDELKRFGGTTLAEVLKRVPSLLGSTSYLEDRSIISSRGDQPGTTGNHVLLLLNGRPMREVMAGGVNSEVLESFPVSVIDRIEVIRGPGSVLYGTQAFSGVINIITKSAEDNATSFSGMLGEGLRNIVMADLRYKLGDLGVVIAGRWADKGGRTVDWQAPGLTQIYTNRVTIPDYGPGAYAQVDYKNLRLMGSYNQWQNEGYLPGLQWFRDVPAIGVSDVHGAITFKKLFADAGYTRKFNDWYNTSLNVTYTRTSFVAHGFPNNARDSYEALGEWTNFFSPIKNLNILAGGTMAFVTGTERDRDNEKLVYTGGHDQYNFSGYTQVDYRREWFKAIGGLQVNKSMVKNADGSTDDFKVDFNPRAGLILYPSEHINIKTLLSTAYRAPSINELYLDYPTMKGKMVHVDDASWYPGHQYYLAPEKVYTLDLGANYADDKVLFGVNAFYSRATDLIGERPLYADYSVNYRDNIGQVTTFGLECEGKYSITKSILFVGSMLYQQSHDDKTGERYVYPTPSFSAKGGLSYQSESGLTLSAFDEFLQVLDRKFYSDLNTPLGNHNILNLHLSYDFNKLLHKSYAKELALVVNADDLLDERVWLPAWGPNTGANIPYNQGRTIYAGFRAAF